MAANGSGRNGSIERLWQGRFTQPRGVTERQPMCAFIGQSLARCVCVLRRCSSAPSQHTIFPSVWTSDLRGRLPTEARLAQKHRSHAISCQALWLHDRRRPFPRIAAKSYKDDLSNRRHKPRGRHQPSNSHDAPFAGALSQAGLRQSTGGKRHSANITGQGRNS